MVREHRRGQLRQVEHGEEPRRVQERAGVPANPVGREIPVVHHPVRDHPPVLGVAVAAPGGGIAARKVTAATAGGGSNQPSDEPQRNGGGVGGSVRRKLPDETEERVRGRGVTFNSLLRATNREHAVRVYRVWKLPHRQPVSNWNQAPMTCTPATEKAIGKPARGVVLLDAQELRRDRPSAAHATANEGQDVRTNRARSNFRSCSALKALLENFSFPVFPQRLAPSLDQSALHVVPEVSNHQKSKKC